jgi:N-acetylglucosamine-6-sulfatase
LTRRRIAVPVLFALLLSLAIVAPASTATPLFGDGFESGLGSWTSVKSLTIGHSTVHQGTSSVRVAGTKKPAWAYKSLTPTRSELYARLWFNITTRTTPVSLLRFRSSSGNPIVSVGISSTGKLTILNLKSKKTTSSSVAVSNHAWHQVQLHAVLTGAHQTDVWFDGNPVAALRLTTSIGSTPFGQVQIGENLSTRTYDMWFDDVAVDTSFLSDGPPADQGPPSKPTGLTAQAPSSGVVQLQWSPSTDDVGVTGYAVYRSDLNNPQTQVGSTTGASATSYTDLTVAPETAYTYVVDATDAAAHRSSKSDPATVTTPAVTTITQPNIVLIITDDQPFDMLDQMPSVQSDLVDEGVTFRNGFVSDPLCCPSRTSILRGQYSHTTGVYDITGPYGGWARVNSEQLESSTLATWLEAAGYRTGLVGKYLNAYGDFSFVPPGWDYWRAASDPYFDYRISEDGVTRRYGFTPDDYKTKVLAGYADQFIRSTPTSTPLFLYLSPGAPHSPFTIEPKYETDPRCDSATNTDAPAFNEADVSDKPAYISHITFSTATVTSTGTTVPQQQCRTLLSVDDMVNTVMQAMTDTGRLNDTFFLFMTDNGFMNGEHRWKAKKVPYESSIRVPFIVRYDPITAADAPRDEDHMVVNIDIAPTLMDLLDLPVTPGCPSPSYSATCTGAFDGTSFLPLLDQTVTSWRSSFLIEHYETSAAVPSYCGVRTDTAKLVRYDTGEEELYDLSTDPDEMQNLMAAPLTPSRQALHDDLFQQLFGTGGSGGLCNPAPPFYPLPPAP